MPSACVIKSDHRDHGNRYTTEIRDITDVGDINFASKSVTGHDEFQAQNQNMHFIPDITPGGRRVLRPQLTRVKHLTDEMPMAYIS